MESSSGLTVLVSVVEFGKLLLLDDAVAVAVAVLVVLDVGSYEGTELNIWFWLSGSISAARLLALFITWITLN